MRFLVLRIIIFLTTHLIYIQIIYAQEQVSPYNARAYFEAEQNTTYVGILRKFSSGKELSQEEEKFLGE